MYLFKNEGSALSIKNLDQEQQLEIFFGASKALNEPWKKLLGKNGFIITNSEDEAESVMAKIEEVGVENFTYKQFA